jgi:hypothetical protein
VQATQASPLPAPAEAEGAVDAGRYQSVCVELEAVKHENQEMIAKLKQVVERYRTLQVRARVPHAHTSLASICSKEELSPCGPPLRAHQELPGGCAEGRCESRRPALMR